MVAEGLCEQCRESNEDSIHALWFCDSVKAIWMSDQRFSFLHSKRFSTFFAWGSFFQAGGALRHAGCVEHLGASK